MKLVLTPEFDGLVVLPLFFVPTVRGVLADNFSFFFLFSSCWWRIYCCRSGEYSSNLGVDFDVDAEEPDAEDSIQIALHPIQISFAFSLQ